MVLSVDQHDEAGRSFDEAFEATQEVPGATTVWLSSLGKGALIGVVPQGDETHVGGGALFGALIVNATLQSYEATDESMEKVIELIHKQTDQATMVLGSWVAATPTS